MEIDDIINAEAWINESRQLVPHCDDAFNFLSQIIEMIKNKYEDYRGFPGDPEIMYKLICDVIQRHTLSLQLLTQMIKIGEFYQQEIQHACEANPHFVVIWMAVIRKLIGCECRDDAGINTNTNR